MGRSLGRTLGFVLAVLAMPMGLGAIVAQAPLTQPTWRPVPVPVSQPTRAVETMLPSPPRFPVPGATVAQPKTDPLPLEILPVQNQIDGKNQEETSGVSLEIPGMERIFGRLDTELALQQRMRQERAPGDGPVNFPDDVIISKEQYPGRNWPRTYCYVEPNYLIHNRLYFEDLNSERYGWDLGPLSPVVSSMYFARDLALFPYCFASDVWRAHDANTGYCLPGDPVAYYLYPVDLNLGGSAVEIATVVTLLAVFP